MTEEIKEILNGLSKKASIYKMQINEGTSFNTDEYEANVLLNYITNLQKENENLKLQIKGYEQERENVLNDIVSRNEKAVEYIENNLTISSILDGKTSYCLNDYSFDYEELLNILEGGDE